MSQKSTLNEFELAGCRLRGTDALDFAQAQLTLDINELPGESLAPAAWCRPDGRAELVLLVGYQPGTVELCVPGSMAGTLERKLKMFSIGRKLEISPIHRWRPTDSGGWSLHHDHERQLKAVDDASQSATLPSEWIRADIDAAMPWLTPPVSGKFLPQMLGLEALGGLSYQKGCYPGQEVIARVHYRGRLTRRIARFSLEPSESDRPTAPEPGTQLDVGAHQATVLYAACENGVCEGLAVVPAELELPVHAAAEDGVPVISLRPTLC